MAGQIPEGVIEQLSETVRSMQKSLECTICLEMMTEPTKTRCGHSFCKSCIGKVLTKKGASCPLCKKNLNRRNISKDDHLEACIEKVTNLIIAIQIDSHIDIMSYSKQPQDTKESCPLATSQSSRDSNDRKPLKQCLKTAKSSTRQKTVIDNLRYGLSSLNEEAKQLYSNSAHPADEILSRSDIKVRTWLHHLPDDIIENNDNLISNRDNILDATDEIHNDKDNKGNRPSRLKKQSTDCTDHIDEDTDASRISKNARAEQFDEVKKTNSAKTSKLKYKMTHARIRAKTHKDDASKSSVEETNDQNNLSSTAANDQMHQMTNDSISNAVTLPSSSTDWTHIIEFGKETKRGRKRKMKKLNVSIEKNKDPPRIIENVALSQSKKYDLAKIAVNSSMSKEKNSQKQDAIDKNLDSSNAEIRSFSETDIHKKSAERGAKNEANDSTALFTNSPETPLFVMLEEEGKRIPIINLTNNQVSNIVGAKNVNKDFQASQNRCHEEDVEMTSEDYNLLPSSSKRLTPKKFNKSINKHMEKIRDITQASVNDFENLSSFVTAENQTPEPEENNSIRKTLGEAASFQVPQSPISKTRLSLKRKPGIGDNKKTDSPPLSNTLLAERLAIITKDMDDRRNVDFSISKDSVVKFLQMGTMIRRRNVKYFSFSAVKREQSMPAQMQNTSVYNMQQSISKSEMKQCIGNMSCNLVGIPDRSNEPQDMIDIIMMEDIGSVIQAVSKDAKLPTASPRRKVLATSTPKKDIDHHLNRKKTTTIEDATEKSAESVHKTPSIDNSAIQGISRVHSRALNSIKLLSPDKDSQLKFLAIDSPMSEHGESRRANSTRQRQQSELEELVHTKGNNFSTMKNSHFAASTSKLQEPFVENSDKKRERMRYTSDKELFKDDGNDDSSDSASDSDRRRIKLDGHNRSFKNIRSSLEGANKKRHSSSSNVTEVIPLDCEEQHTPKRKFKRVLSTSISDTELESAEHVVKTLKRPRTDDQSDQQNASIMDAPKEKCLPIRCPSQEKLKSQRQSVKSLPLRESDIIFESSSMFNSENIDDILQQPMRLNKNKISEKIAEASNDDIINRVLQINRSQSHTNTCRPLNSPRNKESQKEKTSKECLLQDNFDEIIANVELPQSNEDMIACTNQPTNRNLKSRLLVKQRTSNCPEMTDELCGATQETPMLSASSTNDIFEQQSLKNVKKPSTIATLENLGKENVASSGQKRHDCTVDRREKRNVMANVDTIEKDSCRRIASMHNVSSEKEKFFDESSPPARHINDSISHVDDGAEKKSKIVDDELNLTMDNCFDSLMDVTQHQLQMQKFEEELFSSPKSNRNQGRTQKNPSQEQQHTPQKRKKHTQDNAGSEVLSAEEDDVVERTPERKMKNNGGNVKLLESRRNTSHLSLNSRPHLSVVEQISSISNKRTVSKSGASTPMKEIHPLYQSTPQSSTKKKLENVHRQSDRRKLCFICSGLSASMLATVKEFATKHNADYMNQFVPDVTHVIMSTIGEKRAAKITLKFLQGIAYRKWIVSYEWIDDCIKQGKLLDETPYEATTFNNDIVASNGPQKSRLRENDLFKDFTFYCIGPYANVSLSQYQSLLLATGATVVDSLEALAKKKGLKGIVIQDGVHDDKKIECWYRIVKAAPISDNWIVDCIGHYRLIKLESYIQHLSPQDLYAIGFSQELVKDEELSDDEE
ncbi:breast cancer type 1 susceptibility protein homolog [Nylanderia fulva]|uniref:breast cancer type 1 susceptibility protein homolog n=1 Tax=Nylanderia fulva TaxID=613905 RepID=UPI0010FB3840|nr:breast cancer type 1 susceptibility protein homolog [Nylanderia fulva]